MIILLASSMDVLYILSIFIHSYLLLHIIIKLKFIDINATCFNQCEYMYDEFINTSLL